MTRPDQGATIGIDLGTTYSLVSVLQAGKPLVLHNAIGEQLTPSAVSLTENNEVLVGSAARARLATHPERTAIAFKRDMGTEKLYDLGGGRFTPQQLSAMVLATLKRDAEAALGMPIAEAVVTVPAYFGERQRQATKDAAAIAGLKVERIINEPTAAAMAYGLHEKDRELQAVVLDLGGGTFDVTVLEIIDGIIEIQASAGDARLGGEDFAEALAAQTALRIRTLYGTEVSQDAVAQARLREACDAAKKRLTYEPQTHIVLPAFPLTDGPRDLEIPVSQVQAEEAWTGLLERIRAPILRALRDADLTPEQVDEVILVGGSTRIPCFVRLTAQLFGRMPLRTLPPDEAVAMGAAVQAALKSGDEAVDDMIVTDVAPFTLGISTVSEYGGQRIFGLFSPILDRGTTIPASREEVFSTVEDMQRQIEIRVYQGEHSLVRDNTLLGAYTLKNLPKRPAGEVNIAVRFTYDLNGLLDVDMRVVGTDRVESMLIEQAPGKLSDQEIEAARVAMEGLKFHPRESLPNTTALSRGEALYVELTGAAREELGRHLQAFRAVLEGQDVDEINLRRELLLQSIARLGQG